MSSAVTPTVIDSGQSIEIWLNVSGGSGFFSYNATGLPAPCVALDAPTFGCSPNVAGTFEIQLTARDSLGLLAQANVTVVVNPDPAVASFHARQVAIDLGQKLELEATVSGGTGGPTYTYSGLPLGCTGSNQPVLSCTPRQIGKFTPRVTWTDAVGYSSSATTVVTVNSDPTIASFLAHPANISLGENTTLVAMISGGSGYRVLAYAGLPAGCASRNASTLTCQPSHEGTFNVTLTAVDAANWSVSANATIVVSAGGGSTLNGGAGVPAWGYAIGASLAVSAVVIGLVTARSRRGRRADSPHPRESGEPEPEAEPAE